MSCNSDPQCPIFCNNKNVFYTIDHPFYVENSLSRYPIEALIPALTARGSYTVSDAEQLASYAFASESVELVDSFLQNTPLITAIAFVRRFVKILEVNPEKMEFATLVAAPVATLCSSHIEGNTIESEFRILLKLFNINIDPARQPKPVSESGSEKTAQTSANPDNTKTGNEENGENTETAENAETAENGENAEKSEEIEKIPENEVVNMVVEAAKTGTGEKLFPRLKVTFPEYNPEELFKILLGQQAYLMVINGRIEDAKNLFLSVQESGALGIHQIWLMTTRNDVRAALYRHLKSVELLTKGDEESAQILARIASKYRPIDPKSKIRTEIWQPLSEFASTYSEKDAFVLPHLFNLPDSHSSSYASISPTSSSSQIPDSNNSTSGSNTNSTSKPIEKTSFSSATSAVSSFLRGFSFSSSDKGSSQEKSSSSASAQNSSNQNLSNQNSSNQSSSNQNSFLQSSISDPTSGIASFIDGDNAQFVGNVQMVAGVPRKVRKMLSGQESLTEKLWLLHCEHKLQEMSDLFKSELQKLKSGEKSRSLKFANTYLSQMSDYERETLLDVLCQFGLFVEAEYEETEALIVRICKNKLLFDTNWFSKAPFKFDIFFKRFARFCAEKGLFMPLEMFIAAHPKAKEVDLSDVTEPMVQFIWHMWVKRDPGAATLDCARLVTGLQSGNESFEELLAALPPTSLAPLASFVWNTDPEKFKPGSPETELLAARLQQQYPLLAALVKGQIPHPQGPKIEQPPSKWRNPIWTSKYDLELHDLVSAHFDYDFSKVFTDYYGPFPHFDHPELIKVPLEPPYIHYVKALLPVSAFQQASEDGLDAEKLREVCAQCFEAGLVDSGIRLAALSFIELSDLRCQTDLAVDFKLCVALYDRLETSRVAGNGGKERAKEDSALKDDLTKIFTKHDAAAAKKVQAKLAGGDLEVLVLSALLGVRCALPLDYSAISTFAKRGQPAQLLLFLDRAAEIGADYETAEIVKIITSEMPENPLKEHLLFHFTKTLPQEPTLQESEIPPALVVYRAIRRTDVTPETALLQEASDRSCALYAVIAASLDKADKMMCSLVALLTMSDNFSFSIGSPPSHDVLLSMFLSAERELLEKGKEKEVMKILSLFSEKSIVNTIAEFYVSVRCFTFRQAENAAAALKVLTTQASVRDELLGEVQSYIILDALLPLMESLTKFCAQQSQVHLFRYLELLGNTVRPPSLESRVQMAAAIRGFEDFRAAIVKTDLLGSEEQIVTTFALTHSLELAQAAAAALGVSAEHATQKWLRTQYETATTPAQVLEVHARVVGRLTEVDPLFFIALFAALLPYAQPLSIIELLKFARLHLPNLQKSAQSAEISENLPHNFSQNTNSSQNFSQNTSFSQNASFSQNTNLSANSEENSQKHVNIQNLANALDAVMLFVSMEEFSIEMIDEQHIPTQSETLRILLPSENAEAFPNASLELQSPVLFGVNALKQYFDAVVDSAIQKCLDSLKISDARLLIEWRKKSSGDVLLLESVAKLLMNNPLTEQEKLALGAFGDLQPSGIPSLLGKLAEKKGAHFRLLALESKAASILSIPLEFDAEKYISSPLSLQFAHQNLIKELISVSKIGPERASKALALSYLNLLNSGNGASEAQLNTADFGEKFVEFAKMSGDESLVGNELTKLAGNAKNDTKVALELLLHASIISKEIEDIAQKIDQLHKEIPETSIVAILKIFKAPELLPKLFERIVKEGGISKLPHENLPQAVGHAIMNTVRHIKPFEPAKYFDLTLQYKLYREHAELHMETGQQILSEIMASENTISENIISENTTKENTTSEKQKIGDKSMTMIKKLDNASKHYLLALAYFLHVKCFSLAMSCLKRLALTSLQHDLPGENLIGLEKEKVVDLMCTHDLPYALTIAVAYDLDREDIWAKVLYEQTIAKQGEQFLTAFQYFRPISSKLCSGVVKQYKESQESEGRGSRMRQFIMNIPNLVERYRISKELSFNDQIDQMKESNPVVCEWCEKVLLAGK